MTTQKTRWISTTTKQAWREQKNGAAPARNAALNLEITGEKFQKWDGFGGCFNELGWNVLKVLPATEQQRVLRELFDPRGGCRFNICRLPIGANDYSAEWHSLNENAGDFAMKKFSIARDRTHLLPYIKAALKLNPKIQLFASPWSPPTWFKFPCAYNYGTMIWEKKYLEAYALYFVKFVQAYAREGIKIHQVHPQNEPVADQKLPSCLWTGEQLREFIGRYLGPAIRKARLDTEVWLGTLNTDDYDGFVNTVLADPQAYKHVSGVGFQWLGEGAIQRTYASWPEKRLMQTENECGYGHNNWKHAHHVFGLIQHFIANGVGAYCYWNIILQPGGLSTWGWKQNSMITIDPVKKKVTYNPEFYVMKHFSRFIQLGARRLGIKGSWSGNAAVFENPDGTRVAVVNNPLPRARACVFGDKGSAWRAVLPPESYHTFVL